ncbi:MAG: XRE family transcriptional regulator [Tannerella sp.]|jgi:phage repressor protein C with HTH and peptisase S24 domain|nr:XRE family transcriptional regulator [Tannerella sp.]
MDNTLINRIRHIIKSEKLSVDRFAERIDYNANTIKTLFGRGSNPSIELIQKISKEFPQYSLEWLVSNEGEMLKPNENDSIIQIHKPVKYTEKLIELQDIPLYDYKSAANLKTLFLQKHENLLGTIRLPNIPKCDGAMYVAGDSMDPLIKSGDIICYKELTELNSIVYGEMYVLSIDLEGDEYLTVKYITRSESGKDWIRLESYNPRHNPQDFRLQDINAIALVKISIRMNTM